MNFIYLDPESALPPYLQILTQIRLAIRAKALFPGQTLPAIRTLAANLGVAPNTVARAYTELQEAGLIESDRQHGSRIADLSQTLELKKNLDLLRTITERHVTMLRSLGFEDGAIRDACSAATVSVSGTHTLK